MKRGRRSVPGYDVELFASRIRALHGDGCWIHRLLTNRPGDEVPFGWLLCDGPMDPCHLIPKRLLKREFPHGAWLTIAATPSGLAAIPLRHDAPRIDYPPEVVANIGDPNERLRSLGEMMNDGRNGVPGCRKHHNWMDDGKITLCVAELPAPAVEFACELGLDWYLSSRAFEQGPARV